MMMKKQKMRKRIRISRLLPLVVLCAALVTLSVTTELWAKFLQGERAEEQGTVAAFVFRLEDGDATRFLDLSEIKQPGDVAVYRFELNNGTDGGFSEVTQSYTVVVTVEGNMPLVCTLQRNSEAGVSGDASAPLRTEGTLVAGVAAADTFTLTVEWPASANDEAYANGAAVGRVILEVSSTQMD